MMTVSPVPCSMLVSGPPDDEGMKHCNNILINLSLGKIKGEQRDASLYKSILLQNLLNRRLVEQVEGVTTCKQRQQEMRFILFKRGRASSMSSMCETAPWSNKSSMAVDMDDDGDRDGGCEVDGGMMMDGGASDEAGSDGRDDSEDGGDLAAEPAVNPDTRLGQARLRIRLVMKGHPTSKSHRNTMVIDGGGDDQPTTAATTTNPQQHYQDQGSASPKRPRDEADDDLSSIKRRCQDLCFSGSPQPQASLVM